MPDDRIITTIAVQENCRIIKSGTTNITSYSKHQRETDINRYWSDVDMGTGRRKIFPVEYWQIDILMPLNNQNAKAAFIVDNIHNPNLVTGHWKSFDPANPPTLNDMNSRCFVLSQPYYSLSIEVLTLEQNKKHTIFGIERVKDLQSRNFLIAMIGQSISGEYILYLQNVSAEIIDEDPSGDFDFSPTPGGEGAGGLKLPL